jgi:hypothetical protein
LANVTITMPDDLVRSLEDIAVAQHKTVQQLAVEQLQSFVETAGDPLAGSPAAVLKALQKPPHPTAEDVAELEAAIASGRIPIRTPDVFTE